MTLEVFKQERPDKITMWDRIAKLIAEAEMQQKTTETTNFYNIDQNTQQTEDDTAWPNTDTWQEPDDEVEQRWATNKAGYEADHVEGEEDDMGDNSCYPDNNANHDETQLALDKQDNDAVLGRHDRRRWNSPAARANNRNTAPQPNGTPANHAAQPLRPTPQPTPRQQGAPAPNNTNTAKPPAGLQQQQQQQQQQQPQQNFGQPQGAPAPTTAANDTARAPDALDNLIQSLDEATNGTEAEQKQDKHTQKLVQQAYQAPLTDMQKAIIKQQEQQQLQGIDVANLAATITQQGLDAEGLLKMITEQGTILTALTAQVTKVTVTMETIMEQLTSLHTTMQTLQPQQQQQQHQQQPQPPQQPQPTPNDASSATQALITATTGTVPAEAAANAAAATSTELPETKDDDIDTPPYAPAGKGRKTSVRSNPMGV